LCRAGHRARAGRGWENGWRCMRHVRCRTRGVIPPPTMEKWERRLGARDVGIGGLRGSRGGRAWPAGSIAPLRLWGRRIGTLSFRTPPALCFPLIDLSYLLVYSAAMQLVTSAARQDQSSRTRRTLASMPAELAPRQSLWGRSIPPRYTTRSCRSSSYTVPMWLTFTYYTL
jgi:hypothetical protein